jgi:hypothetical protein
VTLHELEGLVLTGDVTALALGLVVLVLGFFRRP